VTPRINTDDYVRPTTAAKLLGVGRARVKQLIAAGFLPAVEIDGVWHIRRADVERRAAGESPKRSGPRPGAKPGGTS
jgi:excisionase family DNA binding protein